MVWVGFENPWGVWEEKGRDFRAERWGGAMVKKKNGFLGSGASGLGLGGPTFQIGPGSGGQRAAGTCQWTLSGGASSSPCPNFHRAQILSSGSWSAVASCCTAHATPGQILVGLRGLWRLCCFCPLPSRNKMHDRVGTEKGYLAIGGWWGKRARDGEAGFLFSPKWLVDASSGVPVASCDLEP